MCFRIFLIYCIKIVYYLSLISTSIITILASLYKEENVTTSLLLVFTTLFEFNPIIENLGPIMQRLDYIKKGIRQKYRIPNEFYITIAFLFGIFNVSAIFLWEHYDASIISLFSIYIYFLKTLITGYNISFFKSIINDNFVNHDEIIDIRTTHTRGIISYYYKPCNIEIVELSKQIKIYINILIFRATIIVFGLILSTVSFKYYPFTMHIITLMALTCSHIIEDKIGHIHPYIVNPKRYLNKDKNHMQQNYMSTI